MSSVPRCWCVLQVCCLLAFGLVIAAVPGCAPPAADDSDQPSTAPATVTEPAGELPVGEQPAEEEPLQEEPAVEQPAVEEPAVEEPAAEEPADRAATDEFDPTYVVTVKWLPEPIENPDAEAQTEANRVVVEHFYSTFASASGRVQSSQTYARKERQNSPTLPGQCPAWPAYIRDCRPAQLPAQSPWLCRSIESGGRACRQDHAAGSRTLLSRGS